MPLLACPLRAWACTSCNQPSPLACAVLHAVTLAAYLRAPMPDALIGLGRPGSHAVEFNDLTIELWRLSQAERGQIGAYACDALGGATMTAPSRAIQTDTMYGSELETNNL